jgi:hypothetical protein
MAQGLCPGGIDVIAISPALFGKVCTSRPELVVAMKDEFDALQANGTWTLVPLPCGADVVTEKWVFRHKLHPDGTLDRYKACWVVHGFHQRPVLISAKPLARSSS